MDRRDIERHEVSRGETRRFELWTVDTTFGLWRYNGEAEAPAGPLYISIVT